jgi:hypothetical protein
VKADTLLPPAFATYPNRLLESNRIFLGFGPVAKGDPVTGANTPLPALMAYPEMECEPQLAA